MLHIEKGLAVHSADGERAGTVQEVNEGGFLVRADFMHAIIPCSAEDVASRSAKELVLALTLDQLRVRAKEGAARTSPARGSGAEGVETPALEWAQRRVVPGEDPVSAHPQGGERLEPAAEEPEGSDRVASGNDASMPVYRSPGRSV